MSLPVFLQRVGEVACLTACLASCKPKTDGGATAVVLRAPSANTTASAPPASGARAKPWFSGGFQGQYEAKLAPVEVKTGAPREWKADDGKQSSGPGKLTLHIDNDGVVDGASEGALGVSHASGKVEDDTLRLVLAPDQALALRGVLVANRDGDGFRGAIQASSGDSLTVRSATIELKRQAD